MVSPAVGAALAGFDSWQGSKEVEVRMRVIMLRNISGTRDGAEWPKVGDPLDVGDVEAAELVACGLAKLAGSVEAAAVVPVAETAAVARAPKKAAR